jgi:hypothetical protein
VRPQDYFECPKTSQHRCFEALKFFFSNKGNAKETANKFNFSLSHFKRLRQGFLQKLQSEVDPFFPIIKPGPKKRHTQNNTIDQIVMLRKQNYSIADIKSYLHAENISLSLETIDNILKEEGFAPLLKRTHQERRAIALPKKMETPKSKKLNLTNEEFHSEIHAGPLVFMPLLEQLKIIPAIEESGFPGTKELNCVQMVLSFLALKLLGGLRWSHDSVWNLDRALGFFAGLNVLPKSTTLSTYSYRVTRQANYNFLLHLSRIFNNTENPDLEFNLDFKAIPHWGDASVLEKNWSGSKGKAMKSILALIVQSPNSGMLSYTNAEINHKNQNDAIIDFVDFWKNGVGVSPKMLIFDSKLTTYQNLNLLNKDGICFLTLRRRGKKLNDEANQIPYDAWEEIKIERTKGRLQSVRVHVKTCKLRHYDGEVRQIIITNHGREKPIFLISNDFNAKITDLVRKYAKRWLVEQEIAEQVVFFQLNNPSSSIVVKVDFDLTLSLLAHNLYRLLAKELRGFEHCTADTIKRNFLENGAQINIADNEVTVRFKKKTHLPILLGATWLKKSSQLWTGHTIRFASATTS